ncbi:PIR Superfamily Protein, partial [Plasmodium ovale curtisi]
DLPSKKFYYNFNDEKNITTYNHICENISKIQSDNELIRLCTKPAKNLKYISDNRETITFPSKRCDDINYWICEQLIKNHRVSKSHINVSQIFFKFIFVWKEIKKKLNVSNYSCNFTIGGVSMDDRTERKNFYDFYENYQFLEVYSPHRVSPEDAEKAKEPLVSTEDFQTQTDKSPGPTSNPLKNCFYI